MKLRGLFVVLLMVGLTSVWLVSTAAAEVSQGNNTTMGVKRPSKARVPHGSAQVTLCQKLRVEVIKAAAEVAEKANWAGSVRNQFTEMHNKYANDVNKFPFSDAMQTQLRICKSVVNRWLKNAKKFEDALAKYKRRGCAGR